MRFQGVFQFASILNGIVDGLGLVTARIASYPLLDEASFVLWATGIAVGTIVGVALLAGSQPGRRGDKFIRGAKLKAAPSPIGRVLAAKRRSGLLSVGGIPIAHDAEVEHVLLSGATGTGKSTMMNTFLPIIRDRGDRCFITDLDGSFYARHGRPGDLLLNPSDKRSEASATRAPGRTPAPELIVPL